MGLGSIDLAAAVRIPILYEDRSVLALDKPAGWMLAPDSWDQTDRNLQLALIASIRRKDRWAQSRRIRFLRYVHRLDAETTGVLLMVKSPNAMRAYSELFRGRSVEKVYLAVVAGAVRATNWICSLPLAAETGRAGVITVDRAKGQPAETRFSTISVSKNCSLVEARPITGRTHQIRVHLAAAGHPVVGDPLYGDGDQDSNSALYPMGLRAVFLAYRDPFQRRRTEISAPADEFLRNFGFAAKR
jgi:RluA family pseudouridine synthase